MDVIAGLFGELRSASRTSWTIGSEHGTVVSMYKDGFIRFPTLDTGNVDHGNPIHPCGPFATP